MRRRRTTKMATCCPARRAAFGTPFCKVHVVRTLTLVSVSGPPPRLCPHCHAGPPGWQLGEDCSHCLYCGHLWERRMEVTG